MGFDQATECNHEDEAQPDQLELKLMMPKNDPCPQQSNPYIKIEKPKSLSD